MSQDFLIRGYGAVFNSPALLEGGLRETIAHGAFDLSVPMDLLCWGHDGAALAGTRERSLSFFQDRRGLGFEARLPAGMPYARAAAEAIERRELWGCSVQFSAWRAQEDEGSRRIEWAQIEHLALCSNPRYARTRVWRADVEALPPDLEALASDWEAGRLLAELAAARLDRERRASQPSRSSCATVTGPPLHDGRQSGAATRSPLVVSPSPPARIHRGLEAAKARHLHSYGLAELTPFTKPVRIAA